MTYIPKKPEPPDDDWEDELQPLGVSIDTAVVLSGLRRPTMLIAAAKGELTVYRDGRSMIVDYHSLRQLMKRQPRWKPPRRRADKASTATPPDTDKDRAA